MEREKKQFSFGFAYKASWSTSFFYGLIMFLVPIKLGTSKFSPYLILIGFLVPTKRKITSNFSPCSNKVYLIILKLLNF